MTTDTALGVTKIVVDDGVPLNEIPFIVRVTSYVLSTHAQTTRRTILQLGLMPKNLSKCLFVSLDISSV